MQSRNAFFSAITLLLLAISLLLPQPASVSAAPVHLQGGVVFVKGDAAGNNNGASWADAYTSLQAGINAAKAGDEVWVAAGSYSPGAEATDSFVMKEGVKIYGGFAGTETALRQRNWQSNVTTLSGGDVNYHVIYNNYPSNIPLTSAAVLDGFSITGGYMNYKSSPHERGAGMYNAYASPTLTNLTFSGNTAYSFGGGMYNGAASTPTLTNVTFRGNVASRGGGMYNGDNNPTLTNVTFSGNIAVLYGGGMYNGYSTLTLTHVTFSGNSAGVSGGGMYIEGGSPKVRNSILWGNTPDQIGGLPATIRYSDVQGGYEGTGNIKVDPLFVDAANGDLRLQATSPAKNAGDNALLPSDMLDLDGDGNTSEAIPFDLAGNLRVVGTVDMGAYEYQPIYVDDSATSGANNGASWANAYTSLQTTLGSVTAGDEVWVAAGNYSPGAEATDSFVMQEGVKIYGGFAGTETALSDRNWQSNVTTLSGGGVNYHVIFNNNNGLTSAAVLDGFSITGGNANSDSAPHYSGGGMYNAYASPTLTHVTFSGNSAYYGGGMSNFYASPTLTHVTFSENSAIYGYGGGMYNFSSSPTLTHVTFSGNSADNAGGGMCNSSSSSPTLTHVTFSGNSADNAGGGMYNASSSPSLTHVTFSGNAATDGLGGGMYNASSSPMLTHVTFSGNAATYYGGGMYNFSSSPTLTHVTFNGNSVPIANGIGGGMYNYSSSPTVRNSILWGNTPDQIRNVDSSATIRYSDVQGGYEGTGNIDDDPLFVDAVNGDLRLQATSPAINRGDNALLPADMLDLDGDGNTSEAIPFDLAGNPRVVDGAVDMGAYENQAPNHAPLLSGAYSLTALAEDPAANPGSLISGFLTGAGVSDADGNPLGIAIIGADNDHGQWQYSSDGATWTDISGVSDTGALLLARSAWLRFMPHTDWNGTTTLTLRAWDGADGRASGTSGIDVSVNGFNTAFSATSADLSQSVSAVNDAPVNTTAPVISGTVKVGVLLTASTGDWNDTQDQASATFGYAYQWQIADDGAGTNAADIHGATNPTYTPTQAKWVRVRVTATDNGLPGSASASASSAWVQVSPYYLFLPLITR